MYVFAHICTHTHSAYSGDFSFFSKNLFSTRKYGISGHDPSQTEVANTWQIMTCMQLVAHMALTHYLTNLVCIKCQSLKDSRDI